MFKRKTPKSKKQLKKLVAGKKAYCTTCQKWYNPLKKRQFKKHSHK